MLTLYMTKVSKTQNEFMRTSIFQNSNKTNVRSVKKDTKRSSNTLLCLVSFLYGTDVIVRISALKISIAYLGLAESYKKFQDKNAYNIFVAILEN